MMTTTHEHGAAFWQDTSLKTKFQPYSIMFQVEDNCPVYLDDYRDWIEYFVEAFPAHSTTVFIVEGEWSLGNQRIGMLLYTLWSSYQAVIDEHNGVTTA